MCRKSHWLQKSSFKKLVSIGKFRFAYKLRNRWHIRKFFNILIRGPDGLVERKNCGYKSNDTVPFNQLPTNLQSQLLLLSYQTLRKCVQLTTSLFKKWVKFSCKFYIVAVSLLIFACYCPNRVAPKWLKTIKSKGSGSQQGFSIYS